MKQCLLRINTPPPSIKAGYYKKSISKGVSGML